MFLICQMAGGGFNFCCKLLLTLILIALIGVIANNAIGRIKSATSGSSRRRTAQQTAKDDVEVEVTPPLLLKRPTSGIGGGGGRSSRQRVFVNGTLRSVDDVVLELLNQSGAAAGMVEGSVSPLFSIKNTRPNVQQEI